jgi:hypothetical protein
MMACRPTSLKAICCALWRVVGGDGDGGHHAGGISHRPLQRLHPAHGPARDGQQPRNAQAIDQHLLQPHHVAMVITGKDMP